MKKVIALLLAMVLILSAFAGCSSKKDDNKEEGKDKNWTTASGDSTFNGGSQSGSKGENQSQVSSQVTSQGTQSDSGTTSSDKTPSGNNSNGGSSNVSSNNSSNTSSNASSNTSSNASSIPEEEGNIDEIKDISGSGLTQSGVEKIISTNTITNEFVMPAFKKLTFQYSSSKSMCYSLRLPEDYTETKKYPVLMFLHGINNTGKNWDTLGHLSTLYQYNADIVNKAIVISPQAPEMDLWSTNSGGTGEMAFALLKKIEDEYSVDKNRIYIMGLSMGGIGTWGLIEKYPDHFAAASPICGMGDPYNAKKLLNIPIWAWHGTADTTVGYDWEGSTPKMYDAITKAGGKLMIFSKLNGVGHDAWTPAFKSREHLCWMFSQVKGKHQSKEYSAIPYLTVVDANGNIVISEKDAIELDLRDGTGKTVGMKDVLLTLSKEGTQKLSEAYQKSGGKPFTVYFGNKPIITFTATQKTKGRILVIRDVFYASSYNNYYSRILSNVGRE